MWNEKCQRGSSAKVSIASGLTYGPLQEGVRTSLCCIHHDEWCGLKVKEPLITIFAIHSYARWETKKAPLGRGAFPFVGSLVSRLTNQEKVRV
jgi:hypothetical protein